MPNNILEELKTKFEDFASELTQIDRLIALVEELDNEIKTIK